MHLPCLTCPLELCTLLDSGNLIQQQSLLLQAHPALCDVVIVLSAAAAMRAASCLRQS